MSKHPIVHIEFSSNDREADAKFYSELFGWKFQQMPEMNYATFDTEEVPGGGLNPVSEDNPAGTLAVYVGTDDINATLARVEKLGGKAIHPRSEIPGYGYWAFFSDLTGNTVGLFEATSEQT
jgi:predicted enzyme related to lactoylglutathione lyase